MKKILSYQEEENLFISKVFAWMFVGLMTTAFTSLLVYNYSPLIQALVSSKVIFYGLFVVEILLVIYLSSKIDSMSAKNAKYIFLFYSMINGITLSVIFLIYSISSIALTFFVTSGIFAIMAIYGYKTKKNLTNIGSLCFMALIGIIIASIANMFMQNQMIDYIISIVGIIVFVGLIAYDTQKIKEYNIIGNHGTEEDTKEAIMGALSLYLDFINLFLYLLKFLGNSND